MKSSGRLETSIELQAEGTALGRSHHSQHRRREGVRKIAAHNRTAFFSAILVKGAKGTDVCFS